ncbi:hypothetical protein H9Y04_39010 [Streptomyces sp. TRM66268-LWL]|uniref:Membrane transport protein MMPL domain-containing protein n=1 Tax=Streptomyces polyasparticus TaxID=2767826 RepID=A0ABR7SSZ7_9ACTN|nr:hypothetical protein [Streptomyces polyasparticus]MBC9718533.1 hypothetical protein [Streptomyces polyasparticus]
MIVVGGSVLAAWGVHAGAELALWTSVVVAASGGLGLFGLAAVALMPVFKVLLFLAESAKVGPEPAAGPHVHSQGNIPARRTGRADWAALDDSIATDTDLGDASEVWE